MSTCWRWERSRWSGYISKELGWGAVEKLKNDRRSSQPEEGSWEFHRLTAERWTDFEELFGERGERGR